MPCPLKWKSDIFPILSLMSSLQGSVLHFFYHTTQSNLQFLSLTHGGQDTMVNLFVIIIPSFDKCILQKWSENSLNETIVSKDARLIMNTLISQYFFTHAIFLENCYNKHHMPCPLKWKSDIFPIFPLMSSLQGSVLHFFYHTTQNNLQFLSLTHGGQDTMVTRPPFEIYFDERKYINFN